MLKFNLGDKVIVSKYPKEDHRRGPWEVVSRHYDEFPKGPTRTYKCRKDGRNGGTESRSFFEHDLVQA